MATDNETVEDIVRETRRNCDRFANHEDAFAAYVATFTDEERYDYEHGCGAFDDTYFVQQRFIYWLFAPCEEGRFIS